MATTKRKSLSKKVRFEVFKRDKFTCQYCGKMAPDVILHVDHIVPVSKGGTNDILNLVTSCQDCNLGKGARKLDDESVVKKQQRLLKELADKNEQLEMILEWKKSIGEFKDIELNKICQYFSDSFNHRPTENGKKAIKKLLKEFTFQQIIEAIDIAYEKYYTGDDKTAEIAFSKIGGICYNNSRSENIKKQIYYFNYLKKACHGNFNYTNDDRLKDFVMDKIFSDDDFERIKVIVSRSRHWTNFVYNIEKEYGNGSI